jgi:hypothetical protein
MVIGKLLSALVYVFLLIIASIPLASLVFVFGAVGPDDLVRAYAFLFALAFGMGALGLFVSALVRRTQTATVITFVLVLVLSIGTAAAHQFWRVAPRWTTSSSGFAADDSIGPRAEALLWFNPFVALAVCAMRTPTVVWYISSVTGRPYFVAHQRRYVPPIFRGGPIDCPPSRRPASGVGVDDSGGVVVMPTSGWARTTSTRPTG